MAIIQNILRNLQGINEMGEKGLESLKQKLKNFEKALLSLEEILVKVKLQKDTEDFSVYRDSTIKRFEYSLEVARKLMSKYIEYVDKKINGQKLVLKQAFEFDLIEDDIWFTMIDDRNMTTHEYDEQIAMQLLDSIYKYETVLRKFLEIMQSKINEL